MCGFLSQLVNKIVLGFRLWLLCRRTGYGNIFPTGSKDAFKFLLDGDRINIIVSSSEMVNNFVVQRGIGIIGMVVCPLT